MSLNSQDADGLGNTHKKHLRIEMKALRDQAGSRAF